MPKLTSHGLTFSRHLLASFAFAAGMSCALPAHAIVNGTPTTEFKAVGALGEASGVLIADNWVLTAAHVAQSLTVGASSFESLAGASLISGIYTFSGAPFPANDIALVQLSTSLEIATPLLNDLLIAPGEATSLGTLTMASAQNQVPNGYATTTAQSANSTYTDGEGVTHTVNWVLTGGSAQLQGGDSGSALFLGAATDSAGELLLGIASAVLIDESTGAAQSSAYVQLASYKDWIDATMARSGQQAMWVSSVPEPSSLLLLAVGGMAILARRAGQNSRNG